MTLAHDDIRELLGAHALHALESDEAAIVEAHLLECPRCRAEVADHREVAAFLAHTGTDAPPAVWDRIVAAVDGSPKRPQRGDATVIALSTRRMARILTAVAAVAAVVIGVLTAKVVDDGHRVSRLAVALQARGRQQAVLAALADPTARHTTLRGTGGRSADVVVQPDGTGWMVARLPALDADHTYQLWALRGTEKVSLGVLGRRVTVAPFSIAGSIDGLAVTEERAGGVAQTQNAPVVAGLLA